MFALLSLSFWAALGWTSPDLPGLDRCPVHGFYMPVRYSLRLERAPDSRLYLRGHFQVYGVACSKQRIKDADTEMSGPYLAEVKVREDRGPYLNAPLLGSGEGSFEYRHVAWPDWNTGNEVTLEVKLPRRFSSTTTPIPPFRIEIALHQLGKALFIPIKKRTFEGAFRVQMSSAPISGELLSTIPPRGYESSSGRDHP